ncbi:MAG: hypothetical protein Q8J69_03495 [Sphingobacteriaceae bacterium]|jgi:hypothetical protein|nr:hypothetical protein [Sphingobacteriaceae bacterium]
MKKIKIATVAAVASAILFSFSTASSENLASIPVAKCEKKGIPHLSKRNNIVVCMLNHTRCCIIRLTYSNGLVNYKIELDNGDEFFDNYSFIGVDDAGNETYQLY